MSGNHGISRDSARAPASHFLLRQQLSELIGMRDQALTRT